MIPRYNQSRIENKLLQWQKSVYIDDIRSHDTVHDNISFSMCHWTEIAITLIANANGLRKFFHKFNKMLLGGACVCLYKVQPTNKKHQTTATTTKANYSVKRISKTLLTAD